MSKTFYVVVTRTDDDYRRIIELPLNAQDMDGWNKLVRGWSIGPASTDAYIVVEEADLAGVRLGIFPASNHVILWGHIPNEHKLPQIVICAYEDRYIWEPDNSEAGTLYCRFDRHPLTIGDHVIQFSYDKPD